MSSEAEVIRSWRLSESEDLSQNLLKVVILKTYDCRRNGNMKQQLYQRNYKALDAYPLKNAEKGQ